MKKTSYDYPQKVRVEVQDADKDEFVAILTVDNHGWGLNAFRKVRKVRPDLGTLHGIKLGANGKKD